jgi:hypothetical protein
MNNLESYPKVHDVSHIQQIGRVQAYQLVASNQFHVVRIDIC